MRPAEAMSVFDDSWLDDRQALEGADPILRRLAEAGARIRREIADASEPIDELRGLPRPRAVIAAGSEARFIRAMLEPVCPVPFVAWPTHGLPGWVGALDLVVVMASDGAQAGLIATVHEAVRRGAQLLIACPQISTIAEHAGVAVDRHPAHRDRGPARRRHRDAGRVARTPTGTRGASRIGRRRDGSGRRGLLAVRRRLGEPGQGSGHGPGRVAAAGLGRLGARGPSQPPGRRGAAGGQRAGRARRGRRRPAADPRSGLRPGIRSPIPSRMRCRPTGGPVWCCWTTGTTRA